MTICLDDCFTIEFTGIEPKNMFFLTEILNNLGVKITHKCTNSLVCQDSDYNMLLFAVHQYTNRKEINEALDKLLAIF